MNALPLEDCRVIDLTSIVLGPLATLMLADLGADVIKVEAPEGDGLRNAGMSKNPGMGALFLALNRGKRSLSLDLKRAEAKAILRRLVETADVLVHNMRPSAAARLGIDDASVRQINPRIVHCSATGFGEASPRADDPAVDDIIQAGSGMASLLGQTVGRPAYAPSLIADKISGLFLAQAVLAGLLARERDGKGRSVRIPMFETMAAFTLFEHLGGRAFSPPTGEPGYDRLLMPSRRPVRTKDGFVAITPYSKRQWQNFFTFAGRPDLAEDPRVTDAKRRYRSLSELYGLVGELARERTTAEWLTAARSMGIPASAVNSLDDLIEDESLAAQRYLYTAEHPSEGDILNIGQLVRLDGETRESDRPAPRKGAHNEEIMKGAGFSRTEIDDFKRNGLLVE